MKSLMNVLVVTLVLTCVGTVYADASYTIAPPSSGLDHWRYYTWGIGGIDLPNGCVIESATITYNNIHDWVYGEEDCLFTNLLAVDPILGFKVAGYDNQSYIDNYFDDGSGGNLLIGTWSDPDGGTYSSYKSFSHEFGSEEIAMLNSSVMDGIVGFGIDPDCHYYFSQGSIEFSFTTSINPVPAPGALLLGSLGIVLVGSLRRRNIL
ncbi:MAG: hypothetical protein JW860_08800 [Sedimentisphaerales bacterium]|nr:hypothetical protein [Sedimentisphaerales bacterium]